MQTNRAGTRENMGGTFAQNEQVGCRVFGGGYIYIYYVWIEPIIVHVRTQNLCTCVLI